MNFQVRIAVVVFVLLSALGSTVVAQEGQSGREPFDDRYCMTCHGIDGIGNVGVQAPRLAGMEDWYLERQLKLFRDGLRGIHPEDVEGVAMRPMAAKLTDASIRDIVGWVGSWDYVPAPISITGDAGRGEQLYASCAGCHGSDAMGIESMGAPQLAGQNDWYLVTQLKNFKASLRGDQSGDTYGQQMRSMVTVLADEQDIIDVVSYINTLGR